MRLLLSTVLLGFSWFAVVNLAFSAVAWTVSRHALRSGRPLSGAALLALRLLPTCAASLFVAVVFLPAHMRFEPAESDERFGVVLGGLCAAGVYLLARSAGRLSRVWSAARRAREWTSVPVPSAVGDAYEVHGYPGVSLAGIVRTRILIGSRARQALTPDELDLAVAHEHAHRLSLDNLKRCAMFCAPDFFGWTGVAAQLEEQWRAQAEREADARAVAGDERRAVHLASALVKVARLGATSDRVLASPVWSTFDEPPLLETRIRSLVSDSVSAPAAPRLRRGAAIALAAGTAPFVWLTQAAHNLHQLTETLVAVLP